MRQSARTPVKRRTHQKCASVRSLIRALAFSLTITHTISIDRHHGLQTTTYTGIAIRLAALTLHVSCS